jgi:hypothetical protein
MDREKVLRALGWELRKLDPEYAKLVSNPDDLRVHLNGIPTAGAETHRPDPYTDPTLLQPMLEFLASRIAVRIRKTFSHNFDYGAWVVDHDPDCDIHGGIPAILVLDPHDCRNEEDQERVEGPTLQHAVAAAVAEIAQESEQEGVVR